MEIGEQQVTAGQRRKIRQALFAREALRPEDLHHGRAGIVVFELDVHDGQQAVALAVARAADHVGSGDNVIAGEAAALIHLPVRFRDRAARAEMRHGDAAPIHRADFHLIQRV